MKHGKYLCDTVLFLVVFLSFVGCASLRQHSGDVKVPEKTEEREEIEKPRVSQFILGLGDQVRIEVWRQDDFSETVRVESSGIISYAPLGEIRASGLSLAQLRDKLRQGLLKYLVDPKIGITVLAVRSQKIFVLGEVPNPGIFQMDIPMTALEAILSAGGFTPDAKQTSVLLIRGDLKKPILKSLNLKEVYTRGGLAKDISLETGDILYVPKIRIANVERFFGRLSNIISPIVQLERVIVLQPLVVDALKGEAVGEIVIQ